MALEPDWDDLRIFLCVLRGESLSAASRQLKRDPATIGRRIARLEAALGVTLFVKSPQGYVATEAGQRLVEHAEAVESSMRTAQSQISGFEQALTGQVRIGAPDGCATYLLPTVTKSLMENHPGLDIQIVALPRVFNLTRREADVAIAVSRPTAGRLRAQRIADYGLSLVASRDYLLRHPPIRRVADLKGHPVIGYIPDMIFDRELDYLTEFGFSHVDMASNLVGVQLGWLRAGAGIGIAHDFVMPDHPELVKVLPDFMHLTRAFWMIRHDDDAGDARLTRIAGLLVEALRAEIARRGRA